MAGRQAGFDAEGFRDGIRLAFNMGAAPELNDVDESQITFHFDSQLIYTGPVDGEGVPFDPDSTVTRIIPPPVRVPCGIEYGSSADDKTAFGMIQPSKVTISLLDEEYRLVKDAAYIVIGGEKFVYHHAEIPRGLFDVGIYTLIFNAENDL